MIKILNKPNLSLHTLLFFSSLLLIAATSHASSAGETADSVSYGIGFQKLTFVDNSRGIAAAETFSGSNDRRIDIILWYPADNKSTAPIEKTPIAKDSAWPLIIYNHGTMGYPNNATHFIEHLVRHGYIVAAPTFPLTSRASFTQVTHPVITDTPNQPGDVNFVIEQLLADKTFGQRIDANKIGCSGHSLGAITCYFASFGAQTRIPKIKASAMLGAGDPVQAALASNFGFDGVAHAPVSVPALFLTGEKDIFASLGGRPYAAYSRLEPPKYELLIAGGVHVWFRDGNEQSKDGKNPDCLFFEKYAPSLVIHGCKQRGGLIDPALQRTITRKALLYFFEAYLKQDKTALSKLQQLPRAYPETSLDYLE